MLFPFGCPKRTGKSFGAVERLERVVPNYPDQAGSFRTELGFGETDLLFVSLIPVGYERAESIGMKYATTMWYIANPNRRRRIMHCCENHSQKQDTGPYIDPVCGMTVERPDPKLVAVHNGRKYYFCVEACMKEFNRHPDRCLKNRKEAKPVKKGLWGRYLDRLTKATGGREIKCH